MPLIAAALAGLVAIIGAMAVRAIIAIGVGFVTYSFVIPPIKSYIIAQFSGMPTDVLNVFAVCKVDVLITMVLSAVAAKFTVSAALRKATTS